MQNTENIPVLKDDETQYGSVVIDTADKATIDLRQRMRMELA